MKGKYFESTLGHFGVLIVKLHPLLDNAADSGLWVIDELEARDVRATFPQVCQVDVQETLIGGERQVEGICKTNDFNQVPEKNLQII